jgi:hypothetical protein
MGGRHQQQQTGKNSRKWRQMRLIISVLTGCGLAAVISLVALHAADAENHPAASHPTHPARGAQLTTSTVAPVRVCGSDAVLGGGPVKSPKGAIKVPAGDDSGVDFTEPHVVYWFAPGTHTLGAGQYTQIDPGTGATFTGAPGAVLDGMQQNDYAFGGTASDVTISYLTIQNFGTYGGNQNQGAVNNDSGTDWTIDHSTVRDNAGAGVMLGSDDKLSYDCLEDNQQYGFNAYSVTGPAKLVLDHNEIAGNDTYNYESHQPDCGCSGGGKFWNVDGAVITDNWVHNNLSVGMWADTNNRGFDIHDNYIADNFSYGLIYEISYNANITGNTFVRNGLGEGPKNPSFPTGAIYISESGSDNRVPGPYGDAFMISGNTFVDNWSGVILWENSNRFCNSPANTSSGVCTLVDPGTVTTRTCVAANLAEQPYYNDCRWRTQNVLVEDNVFDFNPADLGSACTAANACGFQGIFSEYGTYPSWSPYQGVTVEKHITFGQNNHFESNTYYGPWRFMAYQQGDTETWNQWRGAPDRQDKSSKLSGTSFVNASAFPDVGP